MLAEYQVEETSFSFSERAPEPPERRQQRRHIKILRVGMIFLDGRRELCLIRNISAGGLMAHVYSPVRPGERVTVELKSTQQIAGRVIWVRDATCGIAFDCQVDITELLANPPVLQNGWRPRAPRVEVDRRAMLRSGARTFSVRSRDISQSGVKIETDQPLEIDSEVVVTLENLRPLPGTVRWTNEGLCGIAFHQLVPFAELVGWLRDN